MNDILFRAEQKLVDAMLVTDLLYFATKQPPQKIAVVSSDDDIWPGIYASTVYGAQVHHIQTIAGRATPSYYTRHVRIGYHQYSM